MEEKKKSFVVVHAGTHEIGGVGSVTKRELHASQTRQTYRLTQSPE